jgi:hypothetical protein
MSQAPDQTAVLTLDSLLMHTDPLSRLLPDVTPWTTLAKNLDATYPAVKDVDTVIELCTAYYKHEKKRFVHTKADGKRTDQIVPAIEFLEEFMARNGQWPYIKLQPWYTSGDYVIAVDINYYPDRSGYKAVPAFHKDTGGNNIFVNLIFANAAAIEATEWFADLTQPSTQRAEWQAKLLPARHLEELAAARRVLAPEHDGKDVAGGVTEGAYVYVSWVDDLVWHATPSVNRRLALDADLAIGMYAQLGERILRPAKDAYDNDFQYYHNDLGTWISALSVLGSIAECPTTALHQWLAAKRQGPQDLTNRSGPVAWRELYAGDKAAYERDARERARTDWRVTGTANEANAIDPSLPGSEAIKETPVGLSGRRRTNSRSPGEVERVSKLNENTPRTFIRTWVRILPSANSQELTDNKVVF